jgi:hypothetical protein
MVMCDASAIKLGSDGMMIPRPIESIQIVIKTNRRAFFEKVCVVMRQN